MNISSNIVVSKVHDISVTKPFVQWSSIIYLWNFRYKTYQKTN